MPGHAVLRAVPQVLAMYRASDFGDALAKADRLVMLFGAGHTSVLCEWLEPMAGCPGLAACACLTARTAARAGAGWAGGGRHVHLCASWLPSCTDTSPLNREHIQRFQQTVKTVSARARQRPERALRTAVCCVASSPGAGPASGGTSLALPVRI